MAKAKIRPLATPNPLNRSSPKSARVITSWTAPDRQNFVAIGLWVSVPQIVILQCLWGDCVCLAFTYTQHMQFEMNLYSCQRICAVKLLILWQPEHDFLRFKSSIKRSAGRKTEAVAYAVLKFLKTCYVRWQVV